MVGMIYLQLRLAEQFLEISVFFDRMMTGYWMKFDLTMIERDDFPTVEVRRTFFRNYDCDENMDSRYRTLATEHPKYEYLN